MHVTKIRLSALAMAISVALTSMTASAAGEKPVVQPEAQNDEVAATQVKREETTIGRIARKQRELEELKLDKDIAKLRQESSPVSIPITITSPSRGSVSNPGGEESSHTVTAIFGEAGKLRAEVLSDGVPYVVTKGSTNFPGWKVEDVQVNRVVLSNGKRTKSIYLSAASSSDKPSLEKMLANQLNSQPGLPPMQMIPPSVTPAR